MASASNRWHHASCVHILLSLVLVMASTTALADHAEPAALPGARLQPYPASALDLASIPFKIVYETFRQTDGKENWNSVWLMRTARIPSISPERPT